MKTIYECERCQRQFHNKHECMIHELLHYSDEAAVKYYIEHISDEDICDCCEHVYYAYRAERNCIYKNCGQTNNYKDFKVKEDVLNDFQR